MTRSSAILDALPDGICATDTNWRVICLNTAGERLLGVPRDRAKGRLLQELLPALERGGWEALDRAMAEASSEAFDEIWRAEGQITHLAVRVAPMEGGGVVIHFRDAGGERVMAEQYARLLESIRDGFVAVNAEWKILYVNGAAETLLRLPRERAVGSDLRTLLPSGPPEIAEVLRDTMNGGGSRHLATVRPTGRVFRGRFFDLWTYPLPGGGLSILFQDVSAYVDRERELARLAAEAEEASRAKSRFFAAVSHELRTPLNAIVGYTHLLSSGTYGPTSAGARRAMERAGVCAEHLARLVDDVLVVTSSEIGRLAVSPLRIELGPFLESGLQSLRQEAEEKGLGFSVDVSENAAWINTDPGRLRQLLVALVGNAIKFTEYGEVRIGARAMELDGGMAGVEVSVEDTGPGIAPEHRARIFEAFEQIGDPSRTHSMYRGTGVGLTLSRQLAALLRGALSLEEREGGGAIFVLRLPRELEGA
ncbi:MAG: ATP-binding protein [Gemmatimonadota bacterium]|nr:ATP-binding protein [Gemmatimonadota bacterium]